MCTLFLKSQVIKSRGYSASELRRFKCIFENEQINVMEKDVILNRIRVICRVLDKSSIPIEGLEELKYGKVVASFEIIVKMRNLYIRISM